MESIKIGRISFIKHFNEVKQLKDVELRWGTGLRGGVKFKGSEWHHFIKALKGQSITAKPLPVNKMHAFGIFNEMVENKWQQVLKLCLVSNKDNPALFTFTEDEQSQFMEDLNNGKFDVELETTLDFHLENLSKQHQPLEA